MTDYPVLGSLLVVMDDRHGVVLTLLYMLTSKMGSAKSMYALSIIVFCDVQATILIQVPK